jgi:hypothetical protein
MPPANRTNALSLAAQAAYCCWHGSPGRMILLRATGSLHNAADLTHMTQLAAWRSCTVGSFTFVMEVLTWAFYAQYDTKTPSSSE